MRFQALICGFALAALAALATGANAADVLHMQPAPAYNPAAFNFNGFYLGAQGGVKVGGTGGGTLGIVAGANFNVADPVMLGLEFQSDWLMGGGDANYDFFVLGRAGVVVTSDFLAYAEIGPGWVGGTTSYSFGGGGEYALTDALSVKGEILGIGAMGASPSSTKLQAGLLWHIQ